MDGCISMYKLNPYTTSCSTLTTASPGLMIISELQYDLTEFKRKIKKNINSVIATVDCVGFL